MPRATLSVLFLALLIVISFTLPVAEAAARDEAPAMPALSLPSERVRVVDSSDEAVDRSRPREILWFFDADFENWGGDNAGWQSFDMSGTPGDINHWHKAPPFETSYPGLGDNTWWCGTVNSCYVQGQGYGNGWACYLERDFPLSEWSSPGDDVEFSLDHRYAMEKDYDYGYLDISTDGGETWTTLRTYSNSGFMSPGTPMDWHFETVDMGAYADTDVRIRFRFESDPSYSPQDTGDNAMHSMLNGAWQLDNTTWRARPPAGVWTTHWEDDCEDEGDNGWEHLNLHGVGQTDIGFERYQYLEHISTQRPGGIPGSPPMGSWVYAAVNDFRRMETDQLSWLISPPIDISGATALEAEWDAWVDCPFETNDFYDLYINSAADVGCAADLQYFTNEAPGVWYGGPEWSVHTDNWDAYVGNSWLAIGWKLWNDGEPSGGAEHYAGFILNRQRVGTYVGEPPMGIEVVRYFKDWFLHESVEASADYALVKLTRSPVLVSRMMIASNDGGEFWQSYPMVAESGGTWRANTPIDLMTPGAEVLYYFEFIDDGANVITHPPEPYEVSFEFSMLPTAGMDLLLVDKTGDLPACGGGETRHIPQVYYEEALEILGYEWDRFDVRNPSAGFEDAEGPDVTGLRYYDMIFWFTGETSVNTMTSSDQENLRDWLEDSGTAFHERDLFVSGNDIGLDVVGVQGDPIGFYADDLHADYQADFPAEGPIDLCDTSGDSDFLIEPTPCCALAVGWARWPDFDVVGVVEPVGVTDEEALHYETEGGTLLGPAGVAYWQDVGYRHVVTLGFGIEYMIAGFGTRDPSDTGIEHRVELIGNILDYFGASPTGEPTDVAGVELRNELAPARPNPFNPVTSIDYSVKETGSVTIVVYDIAGRLVRTLLDEEVGAGTSGTVVWDGRDDAGERCASGVYFYRIDAEGFTTARKMALLK